MKNKYEQYTGITDCRSGWPDGSLTAEAAFTVPLIFFAWLLFLNFFQVIRIQEELHYAACESVQAAAGAGFVLRKAEKAGKNYIKEEGISGGGDIEGGIDEVLINMLIQNVTAEVFYRIMLEEYMDMDAVDRSCIRGGRNGIGLLGSSLLTEDGCAELILRYKIRFPITVFPGLEFPVTQKVKMRSFTGEGYLYEEEENGEGNEEGQNAEELVYITENGRVYHISRECTYLRVSVQAKRYQELDNLRNESGGKYTACLYCKGAMNSGDTIYVAKYGDVYHTTVTCSRILRNVKTLPRSEAEKQYSGCSKCVGKER